MLNLGFGEAVLYEKSMLDNIFIFCSNINDCLKLNSIFVVYVMNVCLIALYSLCMHIVVLSLWL